MRQKIRKAVGVHSLKVFKARSGAALGSLIRWVGILPMAGGRNRVVPEAPSNPSHSMIYDTHFTFF